jgi:putative ABC transport system permease protein
MVGTYIFRADKPENMPRIARAIDTMFDNSPFPTRTESEKDFGASFLAFLGNLKLYLAMICAAVTFTILLVSANAISMSVRERTRETAVMRTLGYAPSEILLLIVGESVVISVIGGLLGLGIGFLLLKGASSGGGGGFPLPDIQWQGALIVVGAAIFVGILAAAVPAYITSRKNIVGSLRFHGPHHLQRAQSHRAQGHDAYDRPGHRPDRGGAGHFHRAHARSAVGLCCNGRSASFSGFAQRDRRRTHFPDLA